MDYGDAVPAYEWIEIIAEKWVEARKMVRCAIFWLID